MDNETVWIILSIGLLLILWIAANVYSSYGFIDDLTKRYDQRKRQGFIYIFSDRGSLILAAKVGRTNNLNSRLAAHRTGAPLGLYVWAGLKVRDAVLAERLLHRRYAHRRLQREWFYLHFRLMFDILAIRIHRNRV